MKETDETGIPYTCEYFEDAMDVIARAGLGEEISEEESVATCIGLEIALNRLIDLRTQNHAINTNAKQAFKTLEEAYIIAIEKIFGKRKRAKVTRLVGKMLLTAITDKGDLEISVKK